jgi:hypothetical protein
MNNIHVLPTNIYIYITSSEKIKEGDWIFANQGAHKVIDIKNDKYPYGTLNYKGDKIYHHKSWKKIILTDNTELIADGVQGIDDEFLEWFVKNPGCKTVEVIYGLFNSMGRQVEPTNLAQNHSGCIWKYKIIIPKEESESKHKYVGECKGSDNGCFMDSPGHDCGCFTIVLDKKWFPTSQKETELEEAAENYASKEKLSGNQPKDYIYFSTKEKAEEYIIMNKPCLSINDLRELFDYFEEGSNNFIKLTEFVKLKV